MTGMPDAPALFVPNATPDTQEAVHAELAAYAGVPVLAIDGNRHDYLTRLRVDSQGRTA
jgi:hypothetical protein